MNTTPATNDATRDTTGADLSRQGVALRVAARTLGVSLRTVQRRLDKGELAFIERDGKRFVLLEPDATRRDKTRDSDATHDTTARQIAGLSSERESELKEEVRFLRGLIEGHARAEAELRAALREALKAQPKQLPEGATSGEQLGQVETDSSARNAQNGPQTSAASSNSPQPLNDAESGAKREESGADEWASAYARIADELEMMNR